MRNLQKLSKHESLLLNSIEQSQASNLSVSEAYIKYCLVASPPFCIITFAHFWHKAIYKKKYTAISVESEKQNRKSLANETSFETPALPALNHTKTLSE